MKVFKDVKFVGMRLHPEAGFTCTCFEDVQGKDWYIERKEWTGGVIAVWPDNKNEVGSWSKVAMDYVPVEGQTLYEVDNRTVPESDPMNLLGMYTFDGKTFQKKVIPETPSLVRTKEDILADLDRLRNELLNL